MYTNVTHTRFNQQLNTANRSRGLKVTHKKRFIVFLTCIFVVILSFNIFVKAYAQSNDMTTQPIDSMKSIVVQSGDSLWLIASLYKPDDMKINVYIHQIKKVNELHSSAIVEGQRIYLP
jgi:hypothetical protein